MKITNLIFLIGTCFLGVAQGPFAPPVGVEGSTAIHKDSSIFVAWASHCEVIRGFQNIAQPSLGLTTVGDGFSAVGKAGTNGVVSLGDGGSAVLSFAQPLLNGPGWDFAVFENGFSHTFLELAFVEVSSDGVNFFRFPSTSLTPIDAQVSSFGSVDATHINNLAGKYMANYGTPFDLEELEGLEGLDINAISYIKIIDVVGSIDPVYATLDAQGMIINDPYPTAFDQGGFDLDAVGVIHQQPVSVEELGDAVFSVYPNPASHTFWVDNKDNMNSVVQIFNHTGQLVWEDLNYEFQAISVSNYPDGVYFVTLTENQSKKTVKLIVRH
jgi:hypothetical protein